MRKNTPRVRQAIILGLSLAMSGCAASIITYNAFKSDSSSKASVPKPASVSELGRTAPGIASERVTVSYLLSGEQTSSISVDFIFKGGEADLGSTTTLSDGAFLALELDGNLAPRDFLIVNGRIEITGGPAKGSVREIKSYDPASRRVTFENPLPVAINAGGSPSSWQFVHNCSEAQDPRPAGTTSSEGLKGLTASDQGDSHRFTWLSAADLENLVLANLRLRVTASPGGATAQSETFTLNNRVIATVAGGRQGFEQFADNLGALQATLRSPTAVAISSRGDLFIADSINHRIRRVDSATQLVTTVVGVGQAGFSGDGGPAIQARINFPAGLSLQGDDRLFISDSRNHCIRLVDLVSGTITTVIGRGGSAGFSGDNGPALIALLNAPGGIALRGDELIISDTGNHAIRSVDLNNNIISTLAGNGSPGFSGQNSPATGALLNSPTGVAVLDSAIYFSDKLNQRIRRITGGGTIQTLAGSSSSPGFAGDGAPAIAASFNSPEGLTVQDVGGMVELTVCDSLNHRLRRFQIGGNIDSIAGTGASGFAGDAAAASAAQINLPRGLFLRSGELFIADSSNDRIRKIDGNGIISTAVGAGVLTETTLNGPESIVRDGGLLYVADQNSNRIIEVTLSDGSFRVIAGTGAAGFGGDGGAAVSAQLNAPSGLYLFKDQSGGRRLYFTDKNNNKVRVVDLVTKRIDLVAGSGIFGFGGNGGPATASTVFISDPSGVAVDKDENVYFCDTFNHQIRVVFNKNHPTKAGIIETFCGGGFFVPATDPGTSPTGNGPFVSGNIPGFADGPINAGGFAVPSGLSIDQATGNLYVADFGNNAVREIDVVNNKVRTLAGVEIPGLYIGPGPLVVQPLNRPPGVFFDAGAVYLSEYHRILRFDLSNDSLTRIAGVAAGTPGFSGDGGPATAALVDRPQGLNVSGGIIYIADRNNNRIRAVNTGTITTVAGQGAISATQNGGPATGAQLSRPEAATVDSLGNIYITEYGADWIRKVDARTGIINIFAGNGVPGFSGDGGLAAKAQMVGPIGIQLRETTPGRPANWPSNLQWPLEPLEDPAPEGWEFPYPPLPGSPVPSNWPYGAAAWPPILQGRIYFCDFGNNRIRFVQLETNKIETLAGGGGAFIKPSPIPPTSALLLLPVNLALDAAGNVYIGNFASAQVDKVDIQANTIQTVVGTGVASFPRLFESDAAYLADIGEGGQATAAKIGGVEGICFDDQGNMYLAEAFTHRIRRVDTSGVITTIAGDVFGRNADPSVPSSLGDGGSAIAGRLFRPEGMAYFRRSLYIADAYTSRLRRVDLDSGVITSVVGTGSVGLSGDGGLPGFAELSIPEGVAFDRIGNCYICDAGNNRIRRCLLPGQN